MLAARMIDLDALFDELIPIARSITGDGYRRSIDVFHRYMNFEIHRYRSGTKVFDWTVPQEWKIAEAHLSEVEGRKICDIKDNNLHVVSYSVPVDTVMDLDALQPRLYSLPGQPDLIPYVTSYYTPNWGFCLADTQRRALRDTRYRAVIKSELIDGFVEVAETKLKGSSDRTILLTSYLCHPSMANNELSGPLVLLGLHEKLRATPERYFNYRFVLNPETIGSICYLSSHADELRSTVYAGLVLTCLGGPRPKLSYLLSRRHRSPLDKLMRRLAAEGQIDTRQFDPSSGSDERQYASPGIDLPIGQMARTVYGEYPEYHTSGDTKKFMGIGQIRDSIDQIYALLLLNEKNRPISRYEPACEIQLGKRGLYPNVNFRHRWESSADGLDDGRQQLNAILWILNLADGKTDLVDVANESGMELRVLAAALDKLAAADLIYFGAR
jgi:aminopeptidase-like protein